MVLLIIIYFLLASITTFDMRLTQAKMVGELSDDIALPKWVALLYWFEWGVLVVMFYLNWKQAILIWVLQYLLKILPVLEVIGNILMSPFRKK